jgi:hypothetical protein
MGGRNLDVSGYVEMMEKQMSMERDLAAERRMEASGESSSASAEEDLEDDEMDGLCKRFKESGCKTIEQYLRNCNAHVLGAASEPASFCYYFDVNRDVYSITVVLRQGTFFNLSLSL